MSIVTEGIEQLLDLIRQRRPGVRDERRRSETGEWVPSWSRGKLPRSGLYIKKYH